MPDLKAIFFDGYNTLLYVSEPFGRMHEALRRACCDAPVLAVSAALKEEMDYYRDHCHMAEDERTLRQLGEGCADVFVQGLKRQGIMVELATETVIAALLDSFRFVLFDDVQPALSALRARGLTLGVISNWDFRLPQILDELGLGAEFDFVLTSAVERAPKPDCSMFYRALELAAVTPEEAWHIGDKMELDCYPAMACGIRAILLDRENKEPAPACARIGSLLELVQLVSQSA